MYLKLQTIRHFTTIYLLYRGAVIRYVQTLIAESVKNTTVYTHLLTDSLKRVYRTNHPRNNDYSEEVGSRYLDEINSLEIAIRKQRMKREKKFSRKKDVLTMYIQRGNI